MSPVQQAILSTLIGSGEWVSQKRLREITGYPSGSISPKIRELVEAGAVQCMKPPPDRARDTLIYAEAGLAPLAGATQLKKDAAPSARKKRAKRSGGKKLRGFRAAARARKGKRSKHVKRKHHAIEPRVAITDKGLSMIGAAPPRWALASDGALVDLTDGTEIAKVKARALVDFVRALDAGEA